MQADSECMPLDMQPRVRLPKPWRRRAETVAVLAALIGGGFGLGFVYGSRQGDEEVSMVRESHRQEITRLQDAWSGRLNALSGRVSDAAQIAGEAATTAQAAASTAAKAAKESKK